MMQVLAEQQKLVDENRSLRDRVRELQDIIETKQKLEFHHNAYWTRNEVSSLDGPFSSQEWDYSKRLVRLADYGNAGYGGSRRFVSTMLVTNKSPSSLSLS